MKNITKIFSLTALCAAAVFSSCTKPELSTDQFSDNQVVFSAFAPNPVARGGVLRLTGSNLQKAAAVEIPGVEAITEIEVKKEGRLSEIWVNVPVEGPEVGKVTVVTKDGQRLSSKAELTYSEPIVLESFSPAKALPGDVITFKGDYLNNIREVIFADDNYVTEFEAQSRHELRVVVPAKAVSAKVILGDVDENNNPEGLVANLFYTASELVIGDPTVKTEARGNVKAGTAVTVKGEHLEMIKALAFGEVYADFTVAADGKSITTSLPGTAVDGEIVLTSFAGKEFKAGTYATVVPSGLGISAATVYKAGLNAVITGKDIDLVTGVKLSGVECPFSFDKNITLTIPGAAKEGAFELSLANGKTVSTDAIELVKPTITSVSPLSLYAGDEPVIVEGTDLDLVKKVTLGGKDEEFALKDGKLEVKTSATTVSGKIAVILENGESVESTEQVEVKYHSLVIVTEIPTAQHIGEEVVLKGTNFDLVENIFIGDAKVTKYSLRTKEEVRFLMPWVRAGQHSVKFKLFSGDEETLPTQIEVQLERNFNVVFEGEVVVNWNNCAQTPFSALAQGATILVEYVVTPADYHMLRIINTDWSFNPDGNPTYNKEGISEDGYWQIPVTKELLNNLDGKDLCFSGFGVNITKVSVITEISQEVTIWEGEAVADDWANQPYVLSDGGAELKDAQVGQTVWLYLTPLESEWKLQVVEGHWGTTYLSICAFGADTEDGKFTEYDLDANGGKFGIVLTDEILEAAFKVGGWGGVFVLNGDNCKVTKITLL